MGAQHWWQLAAIIGGWTLVVIGGLLLLRALFRDRSRGRRRCPKCWYDMTGVPEMERDGTKVWTCPECGRSMAIERRLHRTRRHWRTAILAALIALVGYSAIVTEQAVRGGVMSAIPTTALIIMSPWLDPGDVSNATIDTGQQQPVQQSRQFQAMLAAMGAKAPVTWDSRCAEELRSRASSLKLKAAHRWLMFTLPAVRAAWHSPGGPRSTIETDQWLMFGLRLGLVPDRLNTLVWRAAAVDSIKSRDDWPADTPFAARMVRSGWFEIGRGAEVRASIKGSDHLVPLQTRWSRSTGWGELESFVELGQPPVIVVQLSARLPQDAPGSSDAYQRWSTEVRLPPIRFASIDSVLTPYRDAAATAAIVGSFKIDTTIYRHKPHSLVFRLPARDDPAALSPTIGLAVRIEVLRDGEPVLTSPFHSQQLKGEDGLVLLSDVRDTIGKAPQARWTISIRGDKPLALREIGRTQYWDGQVELELKADGSMTPIAQGGAD